LPFRFGSVERVAIIGSGGAGKSHLATQIAARTGLPVVHLDPLFWRAGWQAAPAEEARRALHEAIAGDRWILDGNFLSDPPAADPRFSRADTVIFIDRARAVCLWRAISRLMRDRHRWRPDLPEGCSEGFDLPFLQWVWSYPRTTRPGVLALLRELDHRIDTVHLRSNADVRWFVAAI
jgi:adenylate kinase family enzyme